MTATMMLASIKTLTTPLIDRSMNRAARKGSRFRTMPLGMAASA